jgi:hypothetical protein
VVVVEPLVLRVGVDAEVGRKPTVGANDDVAGRWGEEDGTPSVTFKEHYGMELP